MKSKIKPISGVDDRVRLADAIPLSTPFTLNVFPTNACNFRCNYCAQSLGAEYLRREYQFTYDTMDLSTMEKAVAQMKAFPERFKLVSFMGHGEPLLNRNLPKMIRMVKEAGVARRIEIITNGSLLTPALSRELIDAGLSAIRISLQGICSQKYLDIANVNLDFTAFVENIRYFHSIRRACEVFVKVVDTALAEGEEQLFYQLFGDISDRMYIERVKPVYDGVAYDESARHVAVDRYGNQHAGRLACPLTFYMMSLWPNGDVASCDAIYRPLVLGNVKSGDLAKMWQGDALRDFQAMQLRGERHQHALCCKCCAPDDVSHPLDVLDDAAGTIRTKLKAKA